jgi:hypothetical protein
MPLLINVLRNANQKEYRLLRGKAMECASLIGKFSISYLLGRLKETIMKFIHSQIFTGI